MILSIVEERIYFTFGAFPKIEMRKYEEPNKIWQTNTNLIFTSTSRISATTQTRKISANTEY